MARLRLSHVAGAVFLLIGMACPAFDEASGCATLSPEREPAPETFIASERAVIIWDESRKVEHFIRQASIHTQGADLGFLVPTPQTPELAEAYEQIFDMAAFLGQPNRISPTNKRSPWEILSPFVMSSFLHLDRLNPATLLSSLSETKMAPGTHAVISSQDVAGYRATILAAEDERSLSEWLTANGYLSTPELRAWLKPYVANKWKITAFKLMKTDDGAVLNTGAIRLSFETDRPFYPYSEPSDRQQISAASPQGRALRVSILSNEWMTGSLVNNSRWPNKVEFAGTADPTVSDPSWSKSRWLELAKIDVATHGALQPTKLTTFIDESNPRPGTADLVFSPNPSQGPFRGEAVDFTLPTQEHLVLGHSLADIAVLLMLIVLPTAPFYCGWKVVNQRVEKERISQKSRWARQTYVSPEAVVPRTRRVRLFEGLVGGLAIILGGYYGVQFFLILMGEIVSLFFGWSNLRGNWIWLFPGLLLAEFVICAMALGVIFCGLKVLRASRTTLPLNSTEIPFDRAMWHGLMGGLSFLGGITAVLVVESVVVSML